MVEIPAFFLSQVHPKKQLEVLDWWVALGTSIQENIILFWNETDDNNYLELHYLENEEDEIVEYEMEYPAKDFYEYLVNHELHELYLELSNGRQIHICTAHKKIRQYILMGFIPRRFTCPFKTKSCIINAIAKKYKSDSNEKDYIQLFLP